MKRLLWLVFILVSCVSFAFAGSRYNSTLGSKDYCVTLQNEDGTVQNSDCKPVRFPNHTFFSHTDTASSTTDYYFSVGINWDYTDVPGNSINWTDVQRDMPGAAINWADVQRDIPTDAINWTTQDVVPTASVNWEDITGIVAGKIICINSSGNISYCTTSSSGTGGCTCQ